MKIWYSYKGVPYKGDRPRYYDLHHLDWYRRLSADLVLVQEAAHGYLKAKTTQGMQYFNPIIVGGASYWEVLPFMFWGQRNEVAITEGGALFSFFKDIPGLVSLSFSTLMPGTRLKAHYGDTDAIYRMHIPLSVPAGLPACGLKVGGEERSWENDKIIVFCDGHLHEAWNDTGLPRTILIADVMREELSSRTAQVCYNVRSLLMLQMLYLKVKPVYLLPGFVKGGIRHFIKWFLQIKEGVSGEKANNAQV